MNDTLALTPALSPRRGRSSRLIAEPAVGTRVIKALDGNCAWRTGVETRSAAARAAAWRVKVWAFMPPSTRIFRAEESDFTFASPLRADFYRCLTKVARRPAREPPQTFNSSRASATPAAGRPYSLAVTRASATS